MLRVASGEDTGIRRSFGGIHQSGFNQESPCIIHRNMLLNDLVKRYVPLLLLVTLLLPLGLPAGCRSSHQQSDPDDLLIGAYYYPWWNTKKWSEQEAYVHYPQLGQYVSRDQAVVEKHISWTKPSGIDFFAVSWWGSRWEYNEESAGWRDRTTTDYFTDSAASEDFKYCLLYESGGRLEKDVSGFRHPSTITDSGKTNEAILFEDFGYFTSSYFNNPCYLRVNGRPVLIISLAWEFRDWTNASQG